MPVLQPAQSYYVTVYAPGAVVTTGNTGTTFTVRPGHGFRPNDRYLRNPTTTGDYGLVSSCTATTLTVNASTTWSAGDVIVNLGGDSGPSSPEWDGSPIAIHGNPDFSDAKVTDATVQANVQGEYEYFFRGDGRVWEVIRDTDNDVVDLYRGWNYPDRVNCADYGCELDGTKDDTLSWNATLRAADGLNVPAYLPIGEMLVDQPDLIDTRGIVIEGAHHEHSAILSKAEEGNAIKVSFHTTDGSAKSASTLAPDTFELRNLCIKQVTNALNAGAALLNIDSIDNVRVSNVSIFNDSSADLTRDGVAVACRRFYWGRLEDINVTGWADGKPWGVAFDIAQENAPENQAVDTLIMSGCYATRATYGLKIGENYAANSNSNMRVESCKFVLAGGGTPVDGGTGIYTKTVNPLTIENCLVEGYGDYGIHIDGGNQVAITGNRITGFGFDANGRGIFIDNYVRGLWITCNWINCQTWDTDPNGTGASDPDRYMAGTAAIEIGTSARMDDFFCRNNMANQVEYAFLNNITNKFYQHQWHVLPPYIQNNGDHEDWTRFYTEDLRIGKERGNPINVYFSTDNSVTEANLKWQTSASSPTGNDRFEFNKEVRTSGSCKSASAIGIEGAVTGGWFPGLGQVKTFTANVAFDGVSATATSGTGALPAGTLILGVGLAVTTAIDVATDIDIGTSASATRFGNLATLTAGSTFDIAEGAVQGSPSLGVQISANGGTPTVGAVQVTTYYFEVTAPSEDV